MNPRILTYALAFVMANYPFSFSARAQPQADSPVITSEDILQKKSNGPDPLQKPNAKEQQTTFGLLDQQEMSLKEGIKTTSDQQADLATGQDRANAMVKMLKDTELKTALDKVTAKGNEILKNNPEIRSPIAVIAGAIALWNGKTFQLLKEDEVKVTSHVEAKSRSGDFSLSSPLLNGQLRFDQSNGLNLGVNRSISSFHTSAGLQFNPKSQSINSQLNQRIMPHLNFSVGAGQSAGNPKEGTAKIEYELHF